MESDAPWRFRPKFSLRTLLIAALLAASVGGMWYRWEPWVYRQLFAPSDFAPMRFEDDRSLHFSPNGALIANQDGIWNAETLKLERKSHANLFAISREFTPDGKALILFPDVSSAEDDTGIIIWNFETGTEVQLDCQRCYGFLVLKDSQTAISGSYTDRHESRQGKHAMPSEFKPGIHLWDVSTGKCVSSFGLGRMRAVEISADQQLLITEDIISNDLGIAIGHADLRMWDLRTKQQIGLFVPSRTSAHAAFMKGHELLIVDSDTLSRRDLRLRNPSAECKSADVCAVASPDESRVVAYLAEGSLTPLLLDSSTLRAINARLVQSPALKSSTLRASFSRDSAAFVINNLPYLWSADDGHLLYEFPDRVEHYSPVPGRIAGDGGIWDRRRPEPWWGMLWLPETWFALLCVLLLPWSVWKDWQRK